MANGNEERRFRVGDIVRFKPGYRTPLNFDIAIDEVGTVIGVEPHPPQTRPTYRIRVQFPRALVEYTFQSEYELVSPVAKQTKTLDELKDIIVKAMKDHYGDYDSISISITATGDGGWDAKIIGVAEEPAIKALRETVKLLRLDYELSPEALELASWNRPDNTADQGIQAAKDAQRAFISSAQTGVTEPLEPSVSNATPPGPLKIVELSGRATAHGNASAVGEGRLTAKAIAPRTRTVVIRNKKQVLLQSSILLKALEEAYDYEPRRHGNQPAPELWTDLGLDNQASRTDIGELIEQLKQLNAHLASLRKPVVANKDILKLKKHLHTFLDKYGKTVGTGAGVLTIGAVASLLTYFGAGDAVVLALAWKAVNRSAR